MCTLIEEIRQAFAAGNVAEGVKQCNRAVCTLNKALRNATTVGEKIKISTAIGQAKSYRDIYKPKIVGLGHTKRKETASARVKWVDVESAFKSRMRTGVIVNLKHKDPKTFFADASAIFRRRIQNVLKIEPFIKVNATLCGEFAIIAKATELKYFNTKNTEISRDTNLGEWFANNIQERILTDIEDRQDKDSGWALIKIINLQVNINKFTPQLGSSFIELPAEIARKKACINVANDDNKCFAWAVVSALYPAAKDPQRTSKYPHLSKVFNLKGIQFPMTMRQIPRFEKQNNVSINVYTMEVVKKNEFSVHPTYLSKTKQENHVNLLLIQDTYEEDEDAPPPKYHYVWIKNLSRLVSTQLSKKHGRKFICDRCLHYFYTEAKLKQHYIDCKEMNECRIRLPTEDQKYLKFKNHRNKAKAPFIIYADLECFLVPQKKSQEQEHKACSVGYYVKCSYDDSLSFYRAYRGENCIRWFTNELKAFAEDLETTLLCPIPMSELTMAENIQFNAAKVCHICEKPFSSTDKIVKDHSHLVGVYRGPAHEGCNINFKDTHTVPVVFHNLSGYDAHFIVESLAVEMDGRVDVLPITKEKYISFTKHLDGNVVKFRFIDSFRFMADGLANLASSLRQYPELKTQFKELPDGKLKLLTRKGVYPYDYFDCMEKFDEPQLPGKAAFYNRLTCGYISLEDYRHAQNIWNEFSIKSLGEYSDLYLKTDVLLLADVFEQFRIDCMSTHKLDPAHYYTLPGYTWDCMLRYTDVTLELLTDIDKILFIERGIRGGLSQCSTRYAAANNKYMPNYDPSKPDKYLAYFDINNQYGWAMSEFLPFGGFKWVDDPNFDVTAIPDDADTGFILETTLSYPRELHDAHMDIPFCPEHRTPPGAKHKKLLATVYNKERYVIHYRNLKQALAHGLKIVKIHRILQFQQASWLKSYIDLNTALRSKATTDFQKNLYKLLNNAVFGKTMENIRKHSRVKLLTRWEGRYGAEALIAKPEFKNSTIFNEKLVAIELNKTEIFFNKPIYVGMAILDISKTKIYEFHYDYMKPLYGDQCTACYSDTDSIIYSIQGPNIYDTIREDCHKRFDTSDFPENNRFGIPRVNKKVLGLMKEEQAGKISTEFVGLRSKMYALRVDGQDAVKKIKGVQKSIVKNQVTFSDYLECLNSSRHLSVDQTLIKAIKHKVLTITQPKVALSPHDDKRYIIEGTYNTLPWGHYGILKRKSSAADLNCNKKQKCA